MKKQLENGGILIMTCKERFLKYIAVSTASDEDSTESPSTTRQLELSRRLAEEMLSLGLKNVHMDSCGNAIGTPPQRASKPPERSRSSRMWTPLPPRAARA